MTLQLPVAKPPWTGVGRKLESLLRKALWDYKMLEGQDTIAVALSGGKDSLTLLFLLAAVAGRGFPDFNIVAIHVSGAFSCGAGVDGAYLAAICRELGVEYVERKTEQKLEDLECYSCSRERRRLLFEAAKEHGAKAIAFGHHRDDSAQTLLMNLLHKGEFATMLPSLEMVQYGVRILRPLIYASEEQIIAFAEQQGFKRIMCRCPVGQNSMRRQVETLIEDMESLYPNARSNLARAGLLYGSDKAVES